MLLPPPLFLSHPQRSEITLQPGSEVKVSAPRYLSSPHLCVCVCVCRHTQHPNTSRQVLHHFYSFFWLFRSAKVSLFSAIIKNLSEQKRFCLRYPDPDLWTRDPKPLCLGSGSCSRALGPEGWDQPLTFVSSREVLATR